MRDFNDLSEIEDCHLEYLSNNDIFNKKALFYNSFVKRFSSGSDYVSEEDIVMEKYNSKFDISI
jgi:hypothetical protein